MPILFLLPQKTKVPDYSGSNPGQLHLLHSFLNVCQSVTFSPQKYYSIVGKMGPKPSKNVATKRAEPLKTEVHLFNNSTLFSFLNILGWYNSFITVHINKVGIMPSVQESSSSKRWFRWFWGDFNCVTDSISLPTHSHQRALKYHTVGSERWLLFDLKGATCKSCQDSGIKKSQEVFMNHLVTESLPSDLHFFLKMVVILQPRWIHFVGKQFQQNVIHPERGELIYGHSNFRDDEVMISPNCCVMFPTSAQQNAPTLLILSFLLLPELTHKFLSRRGWRPPLLRLWGRQSHCSSQGQAGRRGPLPEQTLALCAAPKDSTLSLISNS